MLNVLVLGAGRGSRFVDSSVPKPFIDVKGEPMFIHALNSFNITNPHQVHLVFQEEHASICLQSVPDNVVEVHTLPDVTSGAATTAYRVIKDSIFNMDQPWVIMDCDLVLRSKPITFRDDQSSILVELSAIREPGSSYSYVQDGRVLCVAEKQIISQYRNVGIYHWTSGRLFCDCFEQGYALNMRVNDEFYMAPLYNFAIQQGELVVPEIVDDFISIGTPLGLKHYDPTSSYFNR